MATAGTAGTADIQTAPSSQRQELREAGDDWLHSTQKKKTHGKPQEWRARGRSGGEHRVGGGHREWSENREWGENREWEWTQNGNRHRYNNEDREWDEGGNGNREWGEDREWNGHRNNNEGKEWDEGRNGDGNREWGQGMGTGIRMKTENGNGHRECDGHKE